MSTTGRYIPRSLIEDDNGHYSGSSVTVDEEEDKPQ